MELFWPAEKAAIIEALRSAESSVHKGEHSVTVQLTGLTAEQARTIAGAFKILAAQLNEDEIFVPPRKRQGPRGTFGNRGNRKTRIRAIYEPLSSTRR